MKTSTPSEDRSELVKKRHREWMEKHPFVVEVVLRLVFVEAVNVSWCNYTGDWAMAPRLLTIGALISALIGLIQFLRIRFKGQSPEG